MKKWLLFAVLVALAGSLYFFVPSNITLSQTIIGKSHIDAANRYFTDTSQWARWWPANGCTYAIKGVFYNDVRLSVRYKDESPFEGDIRIAQLNKDSILIGWECIVPAGNNPLKKITAYRKSKAFRQNMLTILQAYSHFIQDSKNIYGINFARTFSKDSTLITMNGTFPDYPSTARIYQWIDSLRDYAAGQGAAEINYPMLNVSKLNATQYKVMVALSLNKELPGTNRIIIKRFVPWKMIEGEAHGGVYSVEKAFEQLYHFRDDHQLSIMAIPFQSLITDRRQEQDTTKWITKVCAPVS